MAAGAAPGPELCPHCRRPFKRLRAHLPHCKAAPSPPPSPGSPPAPGTSPRPAPASASRSGPSPSPASDRGSGARPNPASAPGPGAAPGKSPQPSPATGSVPRPTPAPDPRAVPGTARGAGLATPGSGSGSVRSGPGQPREAAAAGGSEGGAEPAVRDVARSLDLHPEEVEDIPKKLEKGVKVVIQKHRARVVREKEPGSRAGSAGSRGGTGEGTDPGPAPRPQSRKTAPKSKRKEPRSQGAAGSGTGSSEGEKSSLKAAKVLPEPAESRNSRGDLGQQEGRDKRPAGEEHLEGGVGYKAPASALHPKNLHLSLAEAFGAHGRGTSKNELSSLQGPRDSGEQAEGVSEPILSLGRDPGLALLHGPKIQPTCSCQAAGRSARAGAAGLEWIPDLYRDYEGLRIFPGKRFQEDVRITVEAPRGGFWQGQQGPLSERPLMEVRLGELPSWISTCDFSPQGLLGAVQRAWSSYCAKYIHVRRGSPAGISMLLAGSCLLSYGWNYQHLKQHRWRKYH